MQSQIVLIVARTKTYVMYPPNVHISIFSNRPITSSNTSSSKEMPRLLIYLSRLQRLVFPFVYQVYILSCIPSQTHTQFLTNTIQSSSTVVAPYVPVQVQRLFAVEHCTTPNNFSLWCPSCDLMFDPIQLHHLNPVLNSQDVLSMHQACTVQVESPHNVWILHSIQVPLDVSQVALPQILSLIHI